MNYIKMFENAAIKKWESIDKGERRKANYYSNRIIQIMNDLIKQGNLDILEVLFDSESKEVLLEVSCALFDIRKEKSVEILKKLSNGKGSLPFTADLFLNEKLEDGE